MSSVTDPGRADRIDVRPGWYPDTKDAIVSPGGTLALLRDRTSIEVYEAGSGHRIEHHGDCDDVLAAVRVNV